MKKLNNTYDYLDFGLILALLAWLCFAALSGCSGAKYKPYFPEHYDGTSYAAMCPDAVLEGAPPKCADVGWCLERGFQVKRDIAKEGGCVE